MAPVADYLTVNISSPNTPGLRGLQDEGALDELLAAVREARGARVRRSSSRSRRISSRARSSASPGPRIDHDDRRADRRQHDRVAGRALRSRHREREPAAFPARR